MPKDPIKLAADLQRAGLEKENRELEDDGVEPASKQAVPRYVAWMRSDLVLVIGLLGALATYAKWAVILLAAIAFMLCFLILRQLHA